MEIVSTSPNRAIQSAYSQLIGMFSSIEANLTNNQIQSALPPNKINNEIQKEIDNLNNWAIPNQFPIVPVHVIADYKL